MRAQSIVRNHLSVFCSTQTCSPSAPVLGASEAAPGLFGVWPVQAPTKSGKRPVKDSVVYGARPLGRLATTAIDYSGLPLTLLSFACLIARPQQIGPLGSGRIGSDPLRSPSSDRTPSAWPLCTNLLRLAILGSVPSARPSSARPHRIGVLGSGSLAQAPWLEPLQLSASPVPGWTRRVVVGPLRRSAARLRLSVLRAATGARSSRSATASSALFHFGASAPHALGRSARPLSLSHMLAFRYSKLYRSATAISALGRLGARLSGGRPLGAQPS